MKKQCWELREGKPNSPFLIISTATSCNRTDYLQFPKWQQREGTGYSVESLSDTPGWPEFTFPLMQHLQNLLANSKANRFAIIGRRGLGKSTTLLKICETHLKGQTPVFYFTFVENELLFLNKLALMLNQFDSSIPSPTSVFEAIGLFYWLVKSGVCVILDEFQHAKALSRIDQSLGVCVTKVQIIHFLKVLVDKQRIDNLAGNLVIVGSHLTGMDDIIADALYFRGFDIIRFEPWSPLVLYNNLKAHFFISVHDFLKLYASFNGIISLYAELFKYEPLMSPTSNNMDLVINKLFGEDSYYKDHLTAAKVDVLKMIVTEGPKTIKCLTSTPNFESIPGLMSTQNIFQAH